MSRIGQNHFQSTPPGPLFGLWSIRYLDVLKLVRLKLDRVVREAYRRFPSVLPPGSVFPDLRLPTLDGGVLDTADYCRKKHLVVFTGAIT